MMCAETGLPCSSGASQLGCVVQRIIDCGWPVLVGGATAFAPTTLPYRRELHHMSSLGVLDCDLEYSQD